MQVFTQNPLLNLRNYLMVWLTLFCMVTVSAQSPYQPTRAEVLQSYKAAALLDSLAKNSVFKSRITAHWQDDGFWYKNDLADNNTEYWWVSPAARTRQKAFDQDKLATSLEKVSDSPLIAAKLQLANISFDKKHQYVFLQVKKIGTGST